MSGLGPILIVIALLVQFLADENKKKNKVDKKKLQKQTKQKKNKAKKNNQSPKKTVSPTPEIRATSELINSFKGESKRKRRDIVDREKEIFANSEIVSKENLVQDIIFAEIINKPKSKRK